MLQKQQILKSISFGCVLIAVMVCGVFQPALAQLEGLNPLDNPFTTPPIPGSDFVLAENVYLPAPTGPYQVGRTEYHLVDSTRQDIYLPDGVSGPREMMIRVHYPADVPFGAQPAPYVEGGLLMSMTQIYVSTGDPSVFSFVHSHAYTNVPVAATGAPYPVLIYSHGKNSQPVLVTSLLENLASLGYVVVSVEHPHDATPSVFPDGRVLLPPVGTENSLTQAAAAGDQDAINALIQYEVTSRPGDVLFTLSQLAQMNYVDPLLGGALDLANVGLFGHSFGAGTSVWAAQFYNQLDPADPLYALKAMGVQIKAVIPMDPSTVPLVLQDGTPPLEQAVMFMKSSGADCASPIMSDGICDIIQQFNCMNIGYTMPSMPFYFFELAASTHMTYVTDLVLAQLHAPGFDPYQGIPLVGIDPALAVQILNQYTAAFFNQHLKGTAEPLLAGQVGYDVVTYYVQPLTHPLPGCGVPPIPPDPPTAVPEPGTFVLLGLGVLGMLTLIRTRRTR